MRFPLAVGVLVAVGVANAAPVPKAKPKPKDEDAILGAWVLDKFDGPDGPQVDRGPIRFIFTKDGKFAVKLGGGEIGKQEPGRYKLDPTAKPKALDLTEIGGNSAPAIYELDGDTLRICLAEGPNAVRPTEFKATGKRVAVVTFKREKVAKK